MNRNKTLRIAMLSYHSSPLARLGGKMAGGMNVYVRELSKALGARGHHVDIFTRASGADVDEGATEIAPNVRLVRVEAGPKTDVEKTALPAFIGEFANRVGDWAAANQRSYDLVHAHYWMSGLAGIELKDRWGVPMALMMHTLGLVKERVDALPAEEADLRIRGERRALAAADMVVAATLAEQAELQWLYEVQTPNVRVIPPGVDLELFQLIPKGEARKSVGVAAEDKLLLFVGRLEAAKGLETLIRALRILKDAQSGNRPPARLRIIGGDGVSDAASSQELARLQALVEKLGLSEQVEFLGSRKQAELPRHYAAADLVVLPSHHESFGMVALEAMACGAAVIASKVGGLAHLIRDGENGFLVPDGDPDALAQRIAALLQDEALREKAGAAAQRFAGDYAWPEIAAQIEALYFSLT